MLLVFGISLVVGLVGEYKLPFWHPRLELFEMLVLIGCGGELIADGGIFWLSEHLQTIQQTRVVALAKLADDAVQKAQKALADSGIALGQSTEAKTKSGEAIDKAGKANGISLNALSLARGARTEADSFDKRIVSANTLATDAESHLAEALRQAADATAELNRLKSPRLLTNISVLSNSLRRFAGTEYTFIMVSDDTDSLELLKQIDSVLQLNGWKRKKPSPEPSIGLPIAGFDEDFRVAIGAQTGIEVQVDSNFSIESLNVTPPVLWPPLVGAASNLRNGLASCITHTDKGNVRKELVVTTGSSTVVRIAVGRKP
jgi:hypothetical protein